MAYIIVVFIFLNNNIFFFFLLRFCARSQLSLHGITITEGGVDSAFLFEILEINEKLDMSTEAEIEEIGTFIQGIPSGF